MCNDKYQQFNAQCPCWPQNLSPPSLTPFSVLSVRPSCIRLCQPGTLWHSRDTSFLLGKTKTAGQRAQQHNTESNNSPTAPASTGGCTKKFLVGCVCRADTTQQRRNIPGGVFRPRPSSQPQGTMQQEYRSGVRAGENIHYH